MTVTSCLSFPSSHLSISPSPSSWSARAVLLCAFVSIGKLVRGLPPLVMAKHPLTSEFVGSQGCCSSSAVAIDMTWHGKRVLIASGTKIWCCEFSSRVATGDSNGRSLASCNTTGMSMPHNTTEASDDERGCNPP